MNPHDVDDLDAPGSIDTGRTRLRALWTVWSVEVRVFSGALGKPRTAALLLCLKRHTASVRRCGDLVQAEVVPLGVGGRQALHPQCGVEGRERADLLNGSLEIESAPDRGTIVRVTLPA
jgi:hypothetical protein